MPRNRSGVGGPSGYAKPADRPNKGGTVFAGLRQVTADDVWTEEQRRLHADVQAKRAEIEAHRRAGERLEDDLAVLASRLVDTGMTHARVSRLLRVGSARVADMRARAATALALRETGATS